jgi:hypothetical protein
VDFQDLAVTAPGVAVDSPAVSDLTAQPDLNQWLAMEDAAGADPVGEALMSPGCDPFDGFARPVTNLDFRHPFIVNEIRLIYMHHNFPEDSALGGGNANVYAAQAYFRLTPWLQLTATKDGYTDFNPDAFPDEEGWNDLAAGLKINLIHDPARQMALSIGGSYEWTQGSKDILQGGGDGLYDVYLSMAKGCGRTHFIGTAGFQIPGDSSEDNKVFHYHAHIDHYITECFAPLVELNGYHYMSNADRNGGLGIPLDFEGFDYTSLGASDVKGNDVVTLGVGFRYDINQCMSLGTAYEWALTEREDVFDDRITCDLSISF